MPNYVELAKKLSLKNLEFRFWVNHLEEFGFTSQDIATLVNIPNVNKKYPSLASFAYLLGQGYHPSQLVMVCLKENGPDFFEFLIQNPIKEANLQHQIIGKIIKSTHPIELANFREANPSVPITTITQDVIQVTSPNVAATIQNTNLTPFESNMVIATPSTNIEANSNSMTTNPEEMKRVEILCHFLQSKFNFNENMLSKLKNTANALVKCHALKNYSTLLITKGFNPNELLQIVLCGNGENILKTLSNHQDVLLTKHTPQYLTEIALDSYNVNEFLRRANREKRSADTDKLSTLTISHSQKIASFPSTSVETSDTNTSNVNKANSGSKTEWNDYPDSKRDKRAKKSDESYYLRTREADNSDDADTEDENEFGKPIKNIFFPPSPPRLVRSKHSSTKPAHLASRNKSHRASTTRVVQNQAPTISVQTAKVSEKPSEIQRATVSTVRSLLTVGMKETVAVTPPSTPLISINKVAEANAKIKEGGQYVNKDIQKAIDCYLTARQLIDGIGSTSQQINKSNRLCDNLGNRIFLEISPDKISSDLTERKNTQHYLLSQLLKILNTNPTLSKNLSYYLHNDLGKIYECIKQYQSAKDHYEIAAEVSNSNYSKWAFPTDRIKACREKIAKQSSVSSVFGTLFNSQDSEKDTPAAVTLAQKP